MANVFTAKAVETAKPDPKGRREIPDGALPGFYLVVQPSGVRSWALRYRAGGKPKKLTLGAVLLNRRGDEPEDAIPLGQPMTLVEARRAAREALQMLAEGKDPAEVKKAANAEKVSQTDVGRDTLEKQSESFIDRYCKPRNRSWKEVERQFKTEILQTKDPTDKTGKRLITAWKDRNVQDITKRDVIDLLDKIVDRGSPVTANRVFATLRRFYSWLIERDVVTSSPCAGVKRPTVEKSRERVLIDDEIRLFWKATEAFDHPFGPMWRLLLLTGQRRNEVAGMQRAELELSGAEPTWTIPSARTKNGTTHQVPLSPGAVEIIKALPKIGKKGLVFTTTGETSVSGFSRSKGRLDAAMLEILKKRSEANGADPKKVKIPAWTLHDLRRTAASVMARLNINLPVIEKVLNHTSGSFAGIVGVYQRYEFAEEKRRALLAWADFIDTLVAGKPADNVLPFREVS